MPPSRASVDGSKSTLYAMVLFVVLFLAAASIAVYLYINTSQYQKDAQSAEKKFNELATQNDYNQVKPLISGKQTGVGQLNKQMHELAMMINGSEYADTDLAGLNDTVKRRLKPLWEQIKLALADERAPEEFENAGLVKCTEALIQHIDTLMAKYIALDNENTKQKDNFDQQLKIKDDTIAKINSDLDQASKSAKTNKDGYDQLLETQSGKYKQLIDETKQQLNDALTQLKQVTDKNTTADQQLEEAKVQIKELKNLLQQYRPLPDTEMPALQPDGFVVSVVPGEKLAYINLAKNDHIYRGLTFSVYDSYDSIPKSGQGKGTLEVIEIMDTISKCRIVKFDSTNPIMEHDIIANLVWDKTRKYNFCVTGDFDFDRDGRATTEERNRVVSMIEGWGGTVSNTLGVETDFLVLGNPPVLPPRPPDEFDESAAEAVQAYRQAVKQRDEYEAIKKAGADLGVPTFNLSRFLYFIGYY